MSKKTFNWFAKTSASVVLEAELKALGQSAGPVSFRVFNTEIQQSKEVFMQTPTIISMVLVLNLPVVFAGGELAGCEFAGVTFEGSSLEGGSVAGRAGARWC